MSSRTARLLALALLAAPVAARGQGAPAGDGRVIGFLALQDRTGDAAGAAAVGEALRAELGRRGRLVDPDETRDALRRLRIRNGDRVAPLLLRQLGSQLRADWLASATLHEAERSAVPGLTVSLRLYSAATGELIWAGFRGESGLDRRTLLGLGAIAELEALAPLVVRDLLRELPSAAAPRETRSSRLGTVALVPFTGSTAWHPTLGAEAVTEATQAQLLADGVRLVSPNRLHDVLRRLQAGQWGGVTVGTLAALESAAADTVLTGTVEAYELGGGDEPEPEVAVALRLLQAATGRILWTGASERRGGDRQGLFRRGRIHSRGALAASVVQELTRRLDREGVEAARRPEGGR